ncbi:MAG: hypothetical protein IIV06_03500 [Alistipes sp.]|nr:hypothetical protein [Alistipes sp.]MBQ5878959.1 hypothetical protein [Alistipes sp.]
MNYIETAKQYTGNDVEQLFFRPMLTGASADELGIRILYNMPLPTTVQLLDGERIALKKYTEAGWTGGNPSTKYQKSIPMERVKAEMAFSAADYFSLVYEHISGRADVNMQDLTGTILEQAETELFKKCIRENLRATMWLGDTSRTSGFNTFNGLLTSIKSAVEDEMITCIPLQGSPTTPEAVVELFDDLWQQADHRLQDARQEGQLAFYVTSQIYYLYEKYLDKMGVESSFTTTVEGRPTLAYHGIPVIDVRLGAYLGSANVHKEFALLTDRRNLVLAVNTADMPGNEVRMWYNPDEMENRQRAVFMAGTEILDERMLIYAYVE